MGGVGGGNMEGMEGAGGVKKDPRSPASWLDGCVPVLRSECYQFESNYIYFLNLAAFLLFFYRLFSESRPKEY